MLLLLALAGCRSDRTDTPDDAYRLFSSALKRSDVNTAWDSLSPPTRALLEQKSKEISDASKGAIKNDPKLLTFVSGVKVQPIGEVKVLKIEGELAVLEVTDPAGKREQKMAKIGNRWYVDLTDTLQREERVEKALNSG
ncbi:MAG: lipoprotein, partial [Myxococcaceae bacterium]|nr:lipoprotein [Myxococcaceae bacterium]